MKKNTKYIVFIFIMIILTFSIYKIINIRENKKTQQPSNKIEDNNNDDDPSIETPLDNEIDLTGYIDITSENIRGKFSDKFDTVTKCYTEQTISDVKNYDIKSCAVSYFSYMGEILKSEVVKYGKTFFNRDNLVLENGSYKMHDSEKIYKVTSTTNSYLITIEKDAKASGKWNRISKIYQKGNDYVVIFDYMTSKDYDKSLVEDYLNGYLIFYISEQGEDYILNKTLYQKV